MEELKITFYRNRQCKIDNSSHYFSIIRNHFSYDNPKARFTNYSNLPKRLYTITSKGYCDIGFIWKIKEFIKQEEWDLKLKLSDAVKKILVRQTHLELCEVPNEKYQLRDYQFDAVTNALKLGGGLGLVGTGGGKSLIIASTIESFYQANNKIKVLLVVPNLGLVGQMYDDFIEYNCSFSVSKWTGKIDLNEKTNVVIVNTGLLQRIDKNDNPFDKFLKKNNILIYDEAHGFGGIDQPKATTILKQYNYDHVFGFTGSLMENDYGANMVYGYFGRPFYIKDSKSLRDEDYLSKVSVKMMNIYHDIDYKEIYDFKDKNKPDTENYNNEIEYLTYCEPRNEKIKKLAMSLNKNVLILVDRINQGEHLKQILENETNKKVYFIRGSMDVDDRAKIIAEMEKSDDIICIAMSKIFSVGINIRNLHYCIFYYIGKSWYKIIQSVGRGLRLHERKTEFMIFDICDSLIYSSKHAEERKKVYENQKIDYKVYEI